MASVTGSQLTFLSDLKGGKGINLILTDGVTVSGAVDNSKFNIEIFTASAGSLTPLAGVNGTATVQGAIQVGSADIQAGTPSSVETLGTGSFVVIDNAAAALHAFSGEKITMGTGNQTVLGSNGDTIVGGNAGPAADAQLADLRGSNNDPRTTSGPMTAQGGAGGLKVLGGDTDTIVQGLGAVSVQGGVRQNISGGGSGAGTLQVIDIAGLSTITGGAGNLSVSGAIVGPNTIVGSTAGWTFIDDSKSSGGSKITGGSGGTPIPLSILNPNGGGANLGGESVFIKAASGDFVTVGGGTSLTNVDASAGNVNVQGGNGTATGVIEGHGKNKLEIVANTVVVGGSGDTITGGNAPMFIDAESANVTGMSITGGNGAMEIYGGNGDKITGGGTGTLFIHELKFSGNESITGGTASQLTVFDFGKNNTIIGGTGTNWIDSERHGGNSSIVGGNGTATGVVDPNKGTTIAANTVVVSDVGDTVTGGSGTISVQGGTGGATINAGTAAPTTTGAFGMTVEGGNKDVINNLGSGTLLVDITNGISGSETINLGVSHGATTLRDVSGGAGGLAANTTVATFSPTTDTIASKSSVAGTTFLGTSTSDKSGNVVLIFKDGSTMTFVGSSGGPGFGTTVPGAAGTTAAFKFST